MKAEPFWVCSDCGAHRPDGTECCFSAEPIDISSHIAAAKQPPAEVTEALKKYFQANAECIRVIEAKKFVRSDWGVAETARADAAHDIACGLKRWWEWPP